MVDFVWEEDADGQGSATLDVVEGVTVELIAYADGHWSADRWPAYRPGGRDVDCAPYMEHGEAEIGGARAAAEAAALRIRARMLDPALAHHRRIALAQEHLDRVRRLFASAKESVGRAERDLQALKAEGRALGPGPT